MTRKRLSMRALRTCLVKSFICVVTASAASGPSLLAQLDTTFFDDLDHPAIEYTKRAPTDLVARLNAKIAAGETPMTFEPVSGYLRSTLTALGIPIESQIALYSQTSLQARLISPGNPRTIFFNDSVAVAWMRGGFIEVASQDPTQGVIFYALPQQQTAVPQFLRPPVCVSCHHSYNALGIPGMLDRSVATDLRGAIQPHLGNYLTDHRSPFEERWAGRYVTGTPGGIKHMGNPKPGFDGSGYLASTSDIVALLVFDHQTRMMNLITRIGWETRLSLYKGQMADLSEHVREFVDYLLFVDEQPLPGKVQGSSGFAERFAATGPRDSKGRSLRQLDLERRLLRYPCSYMIYSSAFDALPVEARTAIYQRIRDVLTGRDASPRYARLSRADREAILEILEETKPDFKHAG